MEITLTKDLEGLVRSKILDGTYSSPNEVIRDALKLLAARDELNRSIKVGLDQLQRGELVSGDQVHENLARRSQQRRQTPV